MPWNSQLGASCALSNGPALVQRPKQTPALPPSPPPAPLPPPTFLQRRRENWASIKNNAGALLEVLGFLIFIVDDVYILPGKMKRRRQAAMIERRRNEPRPLPRHRRALSVTHLDLSQNSALLSLPREIRLQIYSHVIGYDLLHLVQLSKRLGHMRCTHQSSPDPLVKTHIDTGIFWDLNEGCAFQRPHGAYPFGPYGYGEPLHWNETSDNSLSLLQTSRQMYADASHILYTTNTFDINHPQTLIFLDRTLLPHRIQSIRYLQIKWFSPKDFHHERRIGRTEPDTVETWDQMCQIILTKMTGLRHVRLVYTSLHDNNDSNLPLVFKLQCEAQLPELETFELWRQNWTGGPRFHRVSDGF